MSLRGWLVAGVAVGALLGQVLSGCGGFFCGGGPCEDVSIAVGSYVPLPPTQPPPEADGGASELPPALAFEDEAEYVLTVEPDRTVVERFRRDGRLYELRYR